MYSDLYLNTRHLLLVIAVHFFVAEGETATPAPTLTAIPPNSTLKSGSNVAFMCDSHCPEIANNQYMFYRDDDIIERHSTGKVYPLIEIEAKDEASYTCAVTNCEPQGSTSLISNAHVISRVIQGETTISAPTLTARPPDATLKNGTNILFICSFTCDSTQPRKELDYTFYRNNQIISGTRSYRRTYALKGIEVKDEGSYTCAVWNCPNPGSSTVSNAHVISNIVNGETETAAPTLIATEQYSTLGIGASIGFICSTNCTSDTTTLEYMFYRNYQSINRSSSGIVYHLRVHANDKASYTCAVKNCGTPGSMTLRSNALRISNIVNGETETAAPTLIATPQYSTLAIGANVAFICYTNCTSNTTTLEYMFYRNYQSINRSSSGRVYPLTVQANDEASYTCAVKNCGTPGSMTLRSNTHVISKIVTKPSQPTLTSNTGDPTDGNEITLICTSSNSEVKNYRFIGPFGNHSQTVESSDNSYTITHAIIGVHDGVYECAALIDTVASDPSTALYIKLKPKQPSLVSVVPSNGSIMEDTPFNLTCHTASTSATGVRYLFYRGTTPVQTETSAIYNIPYAILTDSGVYSCVALIDGSLSVNSPGYPISVIGFPVLLSKPSQPTLTSNNKDPTDGDRITLICTSPNNTEVNKYRFTGPNGLHSRSFTKTVNSYTIDHATIGTDDGDYTCAALVDTVASDSSSLMHVILKPKQPSMISVVPRNGTISVNTTFECTCHTTSTSTISVRYVFYKDETPVQTASSQTLIIHNASLLDTGTYSCIAVIGRSLSVKSIAYPIHVLAKPHTPSLASNNPHPTDGDRITLTCTSTSPGVTTYEFKNSQEHTVAQATYNTHTIYPATIDANDGDYTCIVYVGTVASDQSDTLPVHLKPKTPTLISSVPRSVKIVEHTAFSLTCLSESTSSTGVKYMFAKSPNIVHWTDSPIYSIYDSRPSDTGAYTCLVKIKKMMSGSSQHYPLYVLAEPDKPSLTSNNPDPTDGDSITLTCTATTPEATTYVFLRDNKFVVEQSTNTYTINPATIGTNDGVYMCYFYIGTVKAENSTDNKIALKPRTPVLTASVSRNATVLHGTTVTFTCETASTGPDGFYTFERQDRKQIQPSKIKGNVLSLTSISDTGSYTCKVTIDNIESASSPYFPVQIIASLTKAVLGTNNPHPTDGDSITLACRTDASGVTQYVFEKDNNIVAQQITNTYTMNPATIDANDGVYKCYFYKGPFKSENSTDKTIALKPKTPTIISSVPLNVNILEHTAFTLTCLSESTSTTGTSYMFAKGSNKLHWSPNPIYSIYDASPSDTAEYYCVVKIKTCSSGNSEAYPIDVLTEPQKPSLMSNNPDPTDGDSITLTCTSTTPEATTYVFEKNNKVVAQQATNTYTMNPATIGANDGVYKCYFFIGTLKAENSTNKSISLKPKTPVLTASVSRNATVLDGTQVTFTCKTQSTGPDMFYTFERQDKKPISRSYDNVLSLTSTSDSGSYSCKVTIDNIESSSSPYFPVQIIASHTKAVLETNNPHPTDGDSITLACRTDATGVTQYVFEKDNNIVAQQSTNTYTMNPATIGANDGIYTCYFYIGTVKAEDSTEKKIALRPETPVLIASVARDTTVFYGTIVTFTCETESSGPDLFYTFERKDRKPIPPSKVQVNMLSLTSISDSGSYTCKATIDNIESAISPYFPVQITEKPHIQSTTPKTNGQGSNARNTGTNKAPAAGGVCGGLALVIVIAAIVWYSRRQKRKQQTKGTNEDMVKLEDKVMFQNDTYDECSVDTDI